MVRKREISKNLFVSFMFTTKLLRLVDSYGIYEYEIVKSPPKTSLRKQ